ncbi:unnamed protein product [Pipistrellus nathusii]|uniref:Maturase K n=1 Tax=Pipistrellus nathusii TaxID=59473 RepID=A0ABN9ZKW6_PIPNA
MDIGIKSNLQIKNLFKSRFLHHYKKKRFLHHYKKKEIQLWKIIRSNCFIFYPLNSMFSRFYKKIELLCYRDMLLSTNISSASSPYDIKQCITVVYELWGLSWLP